MGASVNPPAAVPAPVREPLVFPQFAEYVEPNARLLVAEFIPLGFSADGKFAYVIEPPDEACGCYFFEFHIQDLKTDRDLYRKYDQVEPAADNAWQTVWQRHGEEFHRQLALHKIVLSKATSGEFPLVIDGKKLTVRIATTRRASDLGDDVIATANVYLSGESWGEKRIARRNFVDQHVLKLSVAAYVQSPLEDRAAVLLLLEGRGWEGPPNPITFDVAGAQLRKRFPAVKKPAP
jgi:hypothetical protein